MFVQGHKRVLSCRCVYQLAYEISDIINYDFLWRRIVGGILQFLLMTMMLILTLNNC